MMGQSTQNVLAAGRSIIGVPYMIANAKTYMDVPPVDISQVFSINCSGLFNLSRAESGLPPVGGTPDYAYQIGPYWWEYLQNPAKQYPPGTYLVNDNVTAWEDHSHVAIVSTWDQWVLQSDNYQGRGVHETEHVADAHQYNTFYYAGLLPDQPVLDGFPGYSASAEDIARWTGDVMEFFGLPRQLFVQCSLPELTTIWIGRPTASIWDLPGFSTAVDNDSYGPVQQRISYYPFPWNFETAVWSFAQQALANAPSFDTGTAEGYGEWIQAVQGSAYPDRYAQWYDTAVGLVGAAPVPIPTPSPVPAPTPSPVPLPTPTPEEDMRFPKYTLAAHDEPAIDFADAAGTALRAAGVDARVEFNAENIALLSRDAIAGKDVTKLNCLVVGKTAHDALDESAKAWDLWDQNSPVWALWADTDAGTLHKMRDWALPWIANAEKIDKDKLLAVFDAVLMAIDAQKYGELLAQAESGDHPAPPPPPDPSMEEKVNILWTAYEKEHAS